MGNLKKNILEYVMIFLLVLVIILLGCLVLNKVFGNREDNGNTNGWNKLLDNGIIDNYKNADGTYGTMKEYYATHAESDKSALISLGLDGAVFLQHDGIKENIMGVSNVVDIAVFDYVNTKCYMLQDDGKLYVYNVFDSLENNFNVEEVEGASDIVKLVEFRYLDKEMNVELWGILAVRENGEYIELEKSGI